MFRRMIPGPGLLAVALLCAGPAAAQDSVTGTVSSTTATTITVLNDSGEEVTLGMDASTRLPRSMVPGSRVRVAVRESGGQDMAGTVTLLSSSNLFSDEFATRDNVTYRNEPVHTADAGYTRTSARPAADTYAAARTDAAATDADVRSGATDAGAADVADNTTYADDDYALPATASPLPVLALTGLLAMGGSFAIRYRRRR